MGFFKHLILILLAISVITLFWVFGKSIFTGLTRWLLWALGALCACAGVIAFLDAGTKPLALIAGFVLWIFAAYLIKVAESLRKKS